MTQKAKNGYCGSLTHTPKDTMPPPVRICATPDGAENVNTFLKEALATALQEQILLESIKRKTITLSRLMKT